MASGDFAKVLAPHRNAKSNKNEEVYVKLCLDKIDTILVPADTINKFMKFKIHAMLFHLPTGIIQISSLTQYQNFSNSIKFFRCFSVTIIRR